jgi:phage tail-like protein
MPDALDKAFQGTRRLLIKNLPAIFQQQADLEKFLAPFNTRFAQIESILDGMERNFAVSFAPFDDFLPWLAQCVGHVFDAEWDEDRRRRFLAQAVELYRWRGTVGGLKRYLDLCLDLDPGEVEIREGRWPGGMQIGVASRIGYVANNKAGEPNGAEAGKPGIDVTSHDYYIVDTVTPTDLPAGLAGERIPDGERIQLYYDADFIRRIDLQRDGVGLGYLERQRFNLGPEFIGELDAKQVSAALRDQFRTHGHELVSEADIEVKEAGRRWRLIHVHKKYDIHLTKNGTLLEVVGGSEVHSRVYSGHFFHRRPPEDPAKPPNIRRRDGLIDYHFSPTEKGSPVIAGGTLFVTDIERPYRFIVDIRRAFPEPAGTEQTEAQKAETVRTEIEKLGRKVRALLDAEKPAHTEYAVRITPAAGRPGPNFMQIGENSSIGLDTTVA